MTRRPSARQPRWSDALRLDLPAAAGRRRNRLYRVAGQPLAADRPVAELEPFRAAAPRLPPPLPPSGPERAPAGEERRVFDGEGWVGRGLRRVESRLGPGGYRIEVEGIGAFRVAPDGGRLTCLEAAAAPGSREWAEALLGPALILALALRGVLCLHASAVAAAGRGVAFLGESGAGKSTLAAALGARGEPGLRAAADDVLPVTLQARAAGPSGGAPAALPRFPQLKLPPESQPGARLPESLPLAAIYLLAGAAPAGAGVEIEPLPPREALLALVRHTVAARLFGRELLEHHLAGCAELAQRLPVARLRYPWEPGGAAAVATALRRAPGLEAAP